MGLTVVLDIPMEAISSGPLPLIMQIYCFKIQICHFIFAYFGTGTCHALYQLCT
jgi:hypothetical protein